MFFSVPETANYTVINEKIERSFAQEDARISGSMIKMNIDKAMVKTIMMKNQ